MHYFSQLFHYDHPWSHVVIGLWHKYPNPHCSHVLSIDVVDRSVDPNTGVIRTERILGCKQKAPGWIVRFFGGSEDAFVREVSFIDPANQTATITSVNLSLSQFATCYESIRYTPSPDGRTTFAQTAEIQARMALWRSAADKLENWLVQRFEQNAHLGKIGFTDVLRQLWEARQQQPAEQS
ncbi:MSF1-domain-containing protein [Trametes elegans]|nr:MSF1-domain-containing protein [Trametes elegans]